MVKDNKVILETKNLTKAFPGVLAVDHVNFNLFEGEVHSIIGENGAGKSTFVNMINGSLPPDEGAIFLDGKIVRLSSPQEAGKKGIGMVHQELLLLPSLSIAENICLEMLVKKNIKIINWNKIYEISSNILEKLGIKYNLYEPLRNLSTAEQQIVCIARALVSDCRVLILDEPTSALALKDIENLFEVIEKVKTQGVSIIFISHKLDEILKISDRITILRDSRKIETFNRGVLTEEKIIELMVGKAIEQKYPKTKKNREHKKEILKVKNLNIKNKLSNISFSANKGEILGIVGSLGAGKSELANSLFGSYNKEEVTAEIFMENKKVYIHSPKDAINKGIALVTEDRRGEGLIISKGIRFNISLPIIRNISCYGGFVKLVTETDIAQQYCNKLSIKCTSVEQITKNLSGGNQQKVVLAKWLAANTNVLIMDEPTRGIDVGAKIEIYKLMNELSHSGVSIILFSSEIQEICEISDRIIVMFRGKFIKEFLNDHYLDKNEVQRLVLSGRL